MSLGDLAIIAGAFPAAAGTGGHIEALVRFRVAAMCRNAKSPTMERDCTKSHTQFFGKFMVWHRSQLFNGFHRPSNRRVLLEGWNPKRLPFCANMSATTTGLFSHDGVHEPYLNAKIERLIRSARTL